MIDDVRGLVAKYSAIIEITDEYYSTPHPDVGLEPELDPDAQSRLEQSLHEAEQHPDTKRLRAYESLFRKFMNGGPQDPVIEQWQKHGPKKWVDFVLGFSEVGVRDEDVEAAIELRFGGAAGRRFRRNINDLRKTIRRMEIWAGDGGETARGRTAWGKFDGFFGGYCRVLLNEIIQVEGDCEAEVAQRIELFYPSRWFTKAVGLTSDNLRQAKHTRNLPARMVGGQNEYSLPFAKKLWPNLPWPKTRDDTVI